MKGVAWLFKKPTTAEGMRAQLAVTSFLVGGFIAIVYQRATHSCRVETNYAKVCEDTIPFSRPWVEEPSA